MKKNITRPYHKPCSHSPLHATETRFSAMVSDIDTGFILTADRIDSPRDPSLLGAS